MRLEIENRTSWRTDHIRQFVVRALRAERAELFTRSTFDRTFRCRVTYARRGGCSGYAFYNSNFMLVRLPKDAASKPSFATVCYHEAAHTNGMRHDEMPDIYKWRGDWKGFFSWAEALPLEKQSPKINTKTKPTPENRLAHAEEVLRLARTREKRATTIRKRWERRTKRLILSVGRKISET